ncbi:MAG: alpha/beta hydrolase [Fibrobacteraceae bacterium]
MKYLIIPGLNNSGPKHWQSFWEKSLPNAHRLTQENWGNPELQPWLASLNKELQSSKENTLIIAHSLGVSLVIHWLTRYSNPYVKGALLVSPSDVDSVEVIKNFAPMPLKRLPIPTVVAASENDVFVSLDRALFFADQWGSKLVNVGKLGHINAETNLGEWPQGKAILADFERSLFYT